MIERLLKVLSFVIGKKVPLIHVTPTLCSRRSPKGIDYLFLGKMVDNTVAVSFAFKGGTLEDLATEPPSALVAPQAIIHQAFSSGASNLSIDALIDLGGTVAIVPQSHEIAGLVLAPKNSIQQVATSFRHVFELREISNEAAAAGVDSARSAIESVAGDPNAQNYKTLLERVVDLHSGLNPLSVPASALDDVGANDILAWRDRHFAKSRLGVCVAGPLDEASADIIVDELFSGLPAGHLPEPDLSTLRVLDGPQVFRNSSRQNEQAVIMIASIEIRSTTPKDFIATQLLAHILAGDEKSRLFKLIREEAKATYGLRCIPEVDFNSISILISGNVDRNQHDFLVEKILEEVRTIHREGPTDTELSHAKAIFYQLHSELLMNSHAAANQVSTLVCAGWSTVELNNIKALIESVKFSEIANIASKLAERPVIIIDN